MDKTRLFKSTRSNYGSFFVLILTTLFLSMFSIKFSFVSLNMGERWPVVVALRKKTRLLTNRSRVQILPGVGLFSSSYFSRSLSSVECPQSGVAL